MVITKNKIVNVINLMVLAIDSTKCGFHILYITIKIRYPMTP